jgi:hypothetical protein
MLARDFATHYRKISGPGVRRSAPAASPPCKKNKDCNDHSHDEHPVLDLKTQQIKMLNQKLHRFRPVLSQNKHFT